MVRFEWSVLAGRLYPLTSFTFHYGEIWICDLQADITGDLRLHSIMVRFELTSSKVYTRTRWVYIPLWWDLNAREAEQPSSTLLVYIPLWWDLNFRGELAKAAMDLFTFHYGEIWMCVLLLRVIDSLPFTFHYGEIWISLLPAPGSAGTRLHSIMVRFECWRWKPSGFFRWRLHSIMVRFEFNTSIDVVCGRNRLHSIMVRFELQIKAEEFLDNYRLHSIMVRFEFKNAIEVEQVEDVYIPLWWDLNAATVAPTRQSKKVYIPLWWDLNMNR